MSRYAERLAGQQAIRQVAEALARQCRNTRHAVWGLLGAESIIGLGLLVALWKTMSFWEWLAWCGIFVLTTMVTAIVTLVLEALVTRRKRKRFERYFPAAQGERELALSALKQYDEAFYWIVVGDDPDHAKAPAPSPRPIPPWRDTVPLQPDAPQRKNAR